MAEIHNFQTEKNSHQDLHRADDSIDSVINRKILLTIALVAVSLTTVITLLSGKICIAYLHHYPFYYDPAAYYQHNLIMFQHWQEAGLWPTLLNELATNCREPVRTVPILLISPNLLTNPFSHLVTAVPLLFSFILMLGVVSFKRTGSLQHAVLSMSLLCSVAGIYDPQIGFAAYWLDLPASMAFGAAALALLQFGSSNKARWLILSGIFGTVTATARFSAAFYLGIFAVPLFCWYLVKNWRLNPSFSISITRPIACFLIGFLPGVVFLGKFFQENAQYYKTYGFAFNATIWQSLSWTIPATFNYMGWLSTTLCASMLVGSILYYARNKNAKRRSIESLIWALWLPLSVLIFLCIVVKAVDGIHPLLYFVPALIVSATFNKGFLNYRFKSISCAMILAMVLLFAIASYRINYYVAGHPARYYVSLKDRDKKIAEYIYKRKAKTFVEFDTETINPSLEVFFSKSWACDSMLPYFSIHDAYFKGWYPGLTPEKVAIRTYHDVTQKIDLIAISPYNESRTEKAFTSVYATIVSRYFSQNIPMDNMWTKLGTVGTEENSLDIYENTKHFAIHL